MLLFVAHLDELVLGCDDFIACSHQVMLKIMHYEVYCNSVLFCLYLRTATRDDNVSILHSWLDEF